MKTLTIAMAIATMATMGCAEETVYLDTVGGGGSMLCTVMCSYVSGDDSAVLSAATSPCGPNDAECTSCDSCKALVDFHATQRSCDDGLNGGRVIHVETVICEG